MPAVVTAVVPPKLTRAPAKLASVVPAVAVARPIAVLATVIPAVVATHRAQRGATTNGEIEEPCPIFIFSVLKYKTKNLEKKQKEKKESIYTSSLRPKFLRQFLHVRKQHLFAHLLTRLQRRQIVFLEFASVPKCGVFFPRRGVFY